MKDHGIDTVLFDWDGTLLNSAAAAYLSFQRTFRELGIELSPEVYQTLYTPNWYRMYERLGLAPALWEKADRLWLKFNEEIPVSLMPKAYETVRELSARGYLLGLVTSGSRCRIVREVEEHRLSGVFRTLVCNEDTVHKKPCPEGLEKAMDALGRRPADCCYVGDTPEDVMMGRSVGMLTFAVQGGYPGNCAESNPAFRLECIASLLDHLPRRGPAPSCGRER